MNKLFVGFSKQIDVPKCGCLFIDDEVPKLPSWRRAKIFDPNKHSFNPLEGMDYRKATAFVDMLLALMPGGENTLTKEEAEYILLEALLSAPQSLETLIEASKDAMREKARRMIGRLLLSPVLRDVFCKPTNFSFKKGSVVLARLSRAEFGDFDCLALGLALMAQFKGQVVIPDFGFYGREAHIGLIREKRLIAGVNTLGELPPKLRQSVLLIKDKVASGATYEDAETLALYERHVRGTNAFNEYVAGAMA